MYQLQIINGDDKLMRISLSKDALESIVAAAQIGMDAVTTDEDLAWGMQGSEATRILDGIDSFMARERDYSLALKCEECNIALKTAEEEADLFGRNWCVNHTAVARAIKYVMDNFENYLDDEWVVDEKAIMDEIRGRYPELSLGDAEYVIETVMDARGVLDENPDGKVFDEVIETELVEEPDSEPAEAQVFRPETGRSMPLPPPTDPEGRFLGQIA